MNVPPIIMAEGVIGSTRQDYISPVALNANITLTDIRNFYGSSGNFEPAIAKLKENGFTIVSQSRFAISFLGTKELFLQIFNADLQVESVGSINFLKVNGATRFNFIDPTGINDYEDYFSGIILFGPGDFSNFPDPPDKESPNQLYLTELNVHLKLEKFVIPEPQGDQVDVAIIDSGFYLHTYFLTQILAGQKTISQRLGLHEGIMGFAIELEKWLSERDRTQNSERFKALELKELLGGQFAPGENEELQAMKDIISRFDQVDATFFLEYTKEYLLTEDPTGHGTSVTAQYLTLFPLTKVEMVKTIQTRDKFVALGLSTFLADLRIAVSLNPKVISISYGFPFPFDFIGSAEGPDAAYNLMKAEIYDAINRGIVVVVPSGNAPVIDKVMDMQNLWQEAINVGGVFIDNDQPEASDEAFGYIYHVRSVPDICAISGNSTHRIWNPQPPLRGKLSGRWEAEFGTSLAAPQVAAVCAMMKTVAPGLTPREVKEILMLTATPVPNGKTAHQTSLNQINQKLSDGRIVYPGLMNASVAIMTAQYLNDSSQQPTLTNIDQIIPQARAFVTERRRLEDLFQGF
jgi:subtilisin family serine protease